MLGKWAPARFKNAFTHSMNAVLPAACWRYKMTSQPSTHWVIVNRVADIYSDPWEGKPCFLHPERKWPSRTGIKAKGQGYSDFPDAQQPFPSQNSSKFIFLWRVCVLSYVNLPVEIISIGRWALRHLCNTICALHTIGQLQSPLCLWPHRKRVLRRIKPRLNGRVKLIKHLHPSWVKGT